MRSVDQWLEEHDERQRETVKKALHWPCVPPILTTVPGLLCALGLRYSPGERLSSR